jgi:hypothetical protein
LEREPGLNHHIRRVNSLVFRIKDTLPRAWILGDLKTVKKGTLDELTDGSFDPATSALADGDILTSHNKPFFKNVDQIDYEENGHIHIELAADSAGVLVLSESAYPGWRVFVDGELRRCLRLNLLFQGVEIEPGKHRVDFIYRPKYFNLFLSISSISLVFFFILWFFSGLYGRRKTSG